MSGRIKARPRQGRQADIASRALAEYEEAQRRRERWALEHAIHDLRRHLGKEGRNA